MRYMLLLLVFCAGAAVAGKPITVSGLLDIPAMMAGSSAETPAQKALESTFGAFECAQWASALGDQADYQRLFELGYARGKGFYRIARKTVHKIPAPVSLSNLIHVVSGSNTKQTQALGVLMAESFDNVIAGPSRDFVIGRLSFFAETDAMSDFHPNPQEKVLGRAIAAAREYARQAFIEYQCKYLK